MWWVYLVIVLGKCPGAGVISCVRCLLFLPSLSSFHLTNPCKPRVSCFGKGLLTPVCVSPLSSSTFSLLSTCPPCSDRLRVFSSVLRKAWVSFASLRQDGGGVGLLSMMAG